MEVLLELKGISKKINETEIIDHINLKFIKSTISVIAGSDGAGKTTLLKIIAGLYKYDKGDIFFKNQNINKNVSILTEKLGYMPEKFSLYPDLTIEENLSFFGSIYNIKKTDLEKKANFFLKKTGLYNFKKRRAGKLSGGMKQKLALLSILLNSPEIIILDEPTTGVDPLSRIEFFDIIKELKAEGSTILISTPYLDEAEIGDYIAFIKEGKLIKEGNIPNLKKYFNGNIYRAKPKKSILETFIHINEKLPGEAYLRGNYIYLMSEKINSVKGLLNDVKKVKPGLEDIYIFFEREYEKSNRS